MRRENDFTLIIPYIKEMIEFSELPCQQFWKFRNPENSDSDRKCDYSSAALHAYGWDTSYTDIPIDR
jgi:hypothetical protein